MLTYQELTAAAIKRASDWDYDVAALQFEVDRRRGGSFTTTLAGRREEFEIFREAWKIAFDFRRQNQGAIEALTTLGG